MTNPHLPEIAQPPVRQPGTVPDGPPPERLPPRARILAAAAHLFIRYGVGAVGVDRIAQEARVSKRSLYQHFQTKDALVADTLNEVGSNVFAQFFHPDGARTPRQRILDVFDALSEVADNDEYFGCPFVNIATEVRSREHPAALVARHYKDLYTAYFEREATAAGADHPHELAEQLTLMFDGAAAHAALYSGFPESARSAVAHLLDTAIKTSA
ncbi:TetR/AcrR family transcriptional regulator [Leifsonia shinshuensis]|uniref:TetR/AcrR family transcriptional regulator n=1 Tax=Leifsonia shinshuensis TaxID=150026 RepID=UPI002856D79B|nr:TetR/AcrR family transcriptional regulator [Leifsonia shinshuensis]MDR6971669.1 AcrR family transcriptional regulator [Leifsonia shinshuensis]